MTKEEALAKYAEDQAAINDQQDAAVDEIVKGADGIAGDLKWQADRIVELQNTPDGWTPADQAKLDAIQQRNQATLQKVQALAQRIKELDALTNPEPPAPTP